VGGVEGEGAPLAAGLGLCLRVHPGWGVCPYGHWLGVADPGSGLLLSLELSRRDHEPRQGSVTCALDLSISSLSLPFLCIGICGKFSSENRTL